MSAAGLALDNAMETPPGGGHASKQTHISTGYLGDICDSEVLQFNYEMARWARPERLTALHPALSEATAGAGAESLRWASRFILEQWELPKPFCFDIAGPNRMALLQPRALEILAEQVGLLLNSPAIQSAISKVQREQILAEIGAERRHFAITRFPLFRRLVMEMQPEPSTAAAAGLAQIQSDGWRLLLSCFSSSEPAFMKRIELKLPREIGFQSPRTASAQQTAWPLFRRLLKLEWPQEWNRCFC